MVFVDPSDPEPLTPNHFHIVSVKVTIRFSTMRFSSIIPCFILNNHNCEAQRLLINTGTILYEKLRFLPSIGFENKIYKY